MNEKIKSMTNLADSGQDQFVDDWTEYARLYLYEQGVSSKFISSAQADYILGKMVTDLVDDGELSTTTLSIIQTLRVNHPHSEDEVTANV